MLQNCTKTSEAATTTMPQAEVVVVHNRPPDFPVIVLLCYTDTAAVDAAVGRSVDFGGRRVRN